jgi:cohesin complex subunit SA-1/2
MLVQSTVVRGAQLTITKRLPAQDHVRLHTESLAFIVKKIASLQEDKKTQARNRALSFFKALAHLLLGVDGKDALNM